MKRLVELGYIIEHRSETGHLLGWNRVKSKVRDDPIESILSQTSLCNAPRYSSNFDHDQELRWVLDSFHKLKATSSIKTERQLRSELFSQMRGYSRREMNEINAYIPDGCVFIGSHEKKYSIAIEVELNHKSSVRIRNKLERYASKGEYDFVLYICKNAYIYESLFHSYEWILINSSSVRFATKKTAVYFALLPEVKLNFLDASFKSTHDEFKLRKFSQ